MATLPGQLVPCLFSSSISSTWNYPNSKASLTHNTFDPNQGIRGTWGNHNVTSWCWATGGVAGGQEPYQVWNASEQIVWKLVKCDCLFLELGQVTWIWQESDDNGGEVVSVSTSQNWHQLVRIAGQLAGQSNGLRAFLARTQGGLNHYWPTEFHQSVTVGPDSR